MSQTAYHHKHKTKKLKLKIRRLRNYSKKLKIKWIKAKKNKTILNFITKINIQMTNFQ